MTTPLFAYLAGVGSVVVALSAGFAGGALVGASLGSNERPEIVAKSENPSMLITQRREISRVQAAALQPAPDEEKTVAAKAITVTDARKIAAERKQADERRKIARAARQERKQQTAIAAARKMLDAKVQTEKAQADIVAPAFGYSPVASFQAPSTTD